MERELEILSEMYMNLESLTNSFGKTEEHHHLYQSLTKMTNKVRELITELSMEEMTKATLVEIILFVNTLQYLPKGTFIKTLMNPNANKFNHIINKLLFELKISNRDLAKQVLDRYRKDYELFFDLFHYKCIFLYFKLLVITPSNQSPVSEELQDAIDTLRETVVVRLEAVRKDDLWILGNHEIEKIFTRVKMNGDVQSLIHLPTLTARRSRNKLMSIINELPYHSVIQSFDQLEGNPSFVPHLQKMQPELRRLYKHLNESVISLLQLYEHFDVAPFVTIGVLEEKDVVLSMLSSLKFSYDDVEEGKPFIIEKCETLDYVSTRWPERHFTVKTVHERGLKYRESYLRKNLVTIFRLESD